MLKLLGSTKVAHMVAPPSNPLNTANSPSLLLIWALFNALSHNKHLVSTPLNNLNHNDHHLSTIWDTLLLKNNHNHEKQTQIK